jgi:hypothetical protein
MSLMNILRGAADQLDFVPGFDPNKDKQGLLSQILSNVGGRMGGGMNPSGTPPIVPQGSVQMPSMGRPISAPGGPMPTFSPARINPLRKLMLGEGGVQETRAANLSKYETELASYEAQQKAQQAAAARQALTSQGVQAGLTGKDLLAFVTNPEEVSKRLAERQGIFSAGQSYQDGGEFTQAPSPLTPELMGNGQIGAFNPNTGVLGDPQGVATPGAYKTAETAGGVIAYNEFDPADTRNLGGVPVKTPLVSVNTGANGPEIGTIPQGFAAVKDPNNPSGYRMEAIPGGPAGIEAQGAATAKSALDNTFDGIMQSYLDLQDKGAIRDTEATTGENLSAFVQSSPVGRLVGKATGSEAESLRETIEALQPSITQAIMSQPGMSARSMDSQRELEFFMKSITTPTADVWANFTTLHALDKRFGSGQLMDRMLQSGRITPDDYARITRSPRVGAVINQVDRKIGELFVMDGSGGQAAADDGLPPGFVILD